MTNKLTRLPFTTVVQDGDDGGNVLFDATHFDKIAQLMKARKRRRLSEEQRRAAGERLRPWQFRPARQGTKSGRESPSREVAV